jgi:hypothetical protein
MYFLAIKITGHVSTIDIAAGADTGFVGACTPAVKEDIFFRSA